MEKKERAADCSHGCRSGGLVLSLLLNAVLIGSVLWGGHYLMSVTNELRGQTASLENRWEQVWCTDKPACLNFELWVMDAQYHS